MMSEQETDPGVITRPGWLVSGLVLAAGIVLALFIGGLGYLLGTRQLSMPGKDSVEVGFARDMITHHAQAVDLATLVRDRTEDPDMRLIALDMILTQQAQIGQMQGWLNVWGHPLASTTPAMTWMGMPTSGLMPGMAAPEQINQLRGLKGTEADGLFLQLMIAHHRSAVEMGSSILKSSKNPVVLALAQSIVASQASEISMMEEMLMKKGIPVPSPDAGTHNSH